MFLYFINNINFICSFSLSQIGDLKNIGQTKNSKELVCSTSLYLKNLEAKHLVEKLNVLNYSKDLINIHIIYVELI